MSKVTIKYQITIPPSVRKELGIFPGCEVDIKREKDKYFLVVDPINDLKKNWRGKIKDGITTDDYLDEIRGEAD